MSLVYITYHNESIFDVEKDMHNDVTYHRHYQSKYQKKVREQAHRPHVIEAPSGQKLLTSSKKCQHATMGEAQTTVRAPCDFLKKKGGVKWCHIKEHECPPRRSIPPVPRYVRPKNLGEKKKVETCVRMRFFKNHQHRANFVKLNIEKNKKMPASCPPSHYVDSVHGDRHRLRPSGLVPVNICGKNFGKVPCYLKMNKNMLAKEGAHCVRKEQSALAKRVSVVAKPLMLDSLTPEENLELYLAQQGVRQLTNAERSEMIAGLKSNFADVFKSYQALPLHTDTMAKKLRKGKLEKKMRQLEQDMFLLESNPTIFISKY